jgi:YggT family protein
MLLDAISEVALFINVFSGVYILAIIAYVITSWIRLPYSLQPVQRFLYDVCEPYLRLWRRLLPMPFSGLDLSPIVAIVVLGVVTRIVIQLLDHLH